MTSRGLLHAENKGRNLGIKTKRAREFGIAHSRHHDLPGCTIALKESSKPSKDESVASPPRQREVFVMQVDVSLNRIGTCDGEEAHPMI